MRFRSKVDLKLFAIVWAFPIYGLFIFFRELLINESIKLPLAAFIFCYSSFLLIAYAGTYYLISGNKLIIANIFLKSSLDIEKIKEINKTVSLIKSIIAAPALSLTRIQIVFEDDSYILLSPRAEAKFISCLKKLNLSQNR